MRKAILAIAVTSVILVLLFSSTQASQAQARCATQTISYQSGPLRIVAHVMKPSGNGPFPVVIYNHGSRVGRAAATTAGLRPGSPCLSVVEDKKWVYFLPERRGYGGSDGSVYVPRISAGIEHLWLEADDVIVPVQTAIELREALVAAGKDVTLLTYPGPHAMFWPPGANTDWSRHVLAFLTEHLSAR